MRSQEQWIQFEPVLRVDDDCRKSVRKTRDGEPLPAPPDREVLANPNPLAARGEATAGLIDWMTILVKESSNSLLGPHEEWTWFACTFFATLFVDLFVSS